MQKLVTLFGGSFNPPHQGHFEMAGYIHQTLKSDEIWMVFSENPFKEMSVYPPLEHRMNNIPHINPKHTFRNGQATHHVFVTGFCIIG